MKTIMPLLLLCVMSLPVTGQDTNVELRAEIDDLKAQLKLVLAQLDKEPEVPKLTGVTPQADAPLVAPIQAPAQQVVCGPDGCVLQTTPLVANSNVQSFAENIVSVGPAVVTSVEYGEPTVQYGPPMQQPLMTYSQQQPIMEYQLNNVVVQAPRVERTVTRYAPLRMVNNNVANGGSTGNLNTAPRRRLRFRPVVAYRQRRAARVASRSQPVYNVNYMPQYAARIEPRNVQVVQRSY